LALMDVNSPPGSEGIPYVINDFTALDVLKNSESLI
jgi:hypothetical protein